MDVMEKLVEIYFKVCDIAGDSPCGCDGCPYGEYDTDNGGCFDEYKKDKIEKLENDMDKYQKEDNGVTVQEWISVKDRLPEYPGHYLVCTSINYWHGGCMDINGNHKYHPNGTPVGYDGSAMSVLDCYYDVTGHWNRVCDSHVTHWMPLPPPPKGE